MMTDTTVPLNDATATPHDDARREQARRVMARPLRRMNKIWYAIAAATVVEGAVNAASSDPALLHSPRGLAVASLLVGFGLWFAQLMRVRNVYIRRSAWPWPIRIAYLWIGLGLAVTAALISLESAFLGLVFIVVGITTSVLEPRKTILPITAAVAVYVFCTADIRASLWHYDLLSLGTSAFFFALSLGICYSITALIRERFERERLIAELQEAHRKLRISAAHEIDLAALRERNRLAREMHDSLGHALVLIAIKIEAAQRLQAVDPARATAEWEDTKSLVRSTMTDLRNSLAGLRLPALEEQPLSEALAGLACDMGRRTGVHVSCSVADEAEALDRALQEALYRVGQEALANVAKHARATHASLALSLRDGTAVLEVSDDGVGLAAAARNGGAHYGVMGMRERLEPLGGVLTLGPRPQGGTLLRASVPVRDR